MVLMTTYDRMCDLDSKCFGAGGNNVRRVVERSLASKHVSHGLLSYAILPLAAQLSTRLVERRSHSSTAVRYSSPVKLRGR